MADVTLHEYCEQIEGFIEVGRFAEALAHGKYILQQYPKYLGAYRVLGKALLEAEQDQLAADMFRRVLSGDPEDFVARVGMSIIYDRQNDLGTAIWHMERAFELAVNNDVIQKELRRLYGRRDGIAKARVELTRPALARLYAQGDLLSRAAEELRALLNAQPDRVDLQVALAEVLWRNEQRLEAAEVCQQILGVLPYCLKANLILGEIWTSSGREEGETHLRRAETLDPEHEVAGVLFDGGVPLAPLEVRITPLRYEPAAQVAGEGQPDWMKEVAAASSGAPPLSDREAALVDLTAALEAQIEIPAWLEEISLGEDVGSPESAFGFDAPAQPESADLPQWLLESAAPSPIPAQSFDEEVELPSWLQDTVGAVTVPDQPAARADAKIEEQGLPDWMVDGPVTAQPELPAQPQTSADLPDWLAEQLPQPAVAPVVAPQADTELPDWLRGIGDDEGGAELLAQPAGDQVETGDLPDWLRTIPVDDGGLVDFVIPGSGTPGEIAPLPAELPDWLAQQMPAQAAPAESVSMPADLPPWLQDLPGLELGEPASAPATTGEPIPPGSLPDWLAQQLPADVVSQDDRAAPSSQAPEPAADLPPWLQGFQEMGEEGEQGVPASREAVSGAFPSSDLPDWLAQQLPPGMFVSESVLPQQDDSPAGEPVPPEAVAMFGWTSFGDLVVDSQLPDGSIEGEVEAPVAAVQPAAAPLDFGGEDEEPAWLRGEGEMPSAEEALAWLERMAVGKEDELRAQAQAEGEMRMAEIMGRAPTPPPAPAAPEMPEVVPVQPEPEPAVIEMVEAPVVPVMEETEGSLMPAVTEPVAAVQPAAAPLDFGGEDEEPAWLRGEGEMPSAEEALAWLERMAVGKEDELRAQAQAEGEVRMAEIMGRTPTPPPAPAVPEMPEVVPVQPEPEPAVIEMVEAPVVPVMEETEGSLMPAVTEPVAAVQPAAAPLDFGGEDEEPAWLRGEGEMPSAEEALAWLERMAVGKEDELRAQAQAEGEMRMAEIMGRAPTPPPAPAVPETPEVVPVQPEPEPVMAEMEVKEALLLPAVMETEAPVEEALEPATPAEIVVEAAQAEKTQGPDEALAWLEGVTAAQEPLQTAPLDAEAWMERVSELPAPVVMPVQVEEPRPSIDVDTWLDSVAVDQAAAADETEGPALDGGGLFGWTQFGEEVQPDVALSAVEPVGESAPIPAFGWTEFLAEEKRVEPSDLAAEPVPSLAAPVLIEPALSPALPDEPAPAPPVLPLPVVPAEIAVSAPVERAEDEEKVAAPAAPSKPASKPAAKAPQKSTRATRPDIPDHQTRLSMARQLRQQGEEDEALAHYVRLISKGAFLDEVVTDLETSLQEKPADPRTRRALGDAYMKAGRLDDALSAYRHALDSL